MADGNAKTQGQTGSELKKKVQVQKYHLVLKLQDAEGKPLAGAPYTLTFVGAPKPKGPSEAGGDGKIDVEVPPGCKEAKLEVGGRSFLLGFDLGKLEPGPSASVPGIKARLRNLGYAIPKLDAKKDLALQVALAAFQADQGLKPDGQASDATVAKLVEVHGC